MPMILLIEFPFGSKVMLMFRLHFFNRLCVEHFTTNGTGIGSFARLGGGWLFRHNPIIADVRPFVRFFSAGALMPMIDVVRFPLPVTMNMNGICTVGLTPNKLNLFIHTRQHKAICCSFSGADQYLPVLRLSFNGNGNLSADHIIVYCQCLARRNSDAKGCICPKAQRIDCSIILQNQPAA